MHAISCYARAHTCALCAAAGRAASERRGRARTRWLEPHPALAVAWSSPRSGRTSTLDMATCTGSVGIVLCTMRVTWTALVAAVSLVATPLLMLSVLRVRPRSASLIGCKEWCTEAIKLISGDSCLPEM